MKRLIRILVFTTLLSVVFVCNASANTINIPADYSTIQAGINAASNGDTVLVQPGTYVENINYSGKNITVASLYLTTQDTSYISQTIIDGDSLDSVVRFENEEDSTAILTGFTITNGYAQGDSWPENCGGGIYCVNISNPSLENVMITGNSANWCGGGISCDNSSPSLENVSITGNSADVWGGGGINCHDSSPSLENVTITGNSAFSEGGGIYCGWYSSPSLDNVTITGNSTDGDGGGICCEDDSEPSLVNVTITGNSANYGGGIYCNYSSPSLQNVTITGNSTNLSGGGIYCGWNSSPIIVNSIISDNTGNYGIYVQANYPGNPTISYSDFWNNEVGNFYGVNDSVGVNITTNANGDSCDAFYNIQLDPLFVDPLNGDYHLSWANYPVTDSTKSPCIDAGDPSSPLDPDGTIADMGAYYFNQNLSVDDPQEITTYHFTNYPNPISSNINNLSVSFYIHKPSNVKIQLFNIKGQLVSTLINEDKNIGEYTINHPVNDLSSGIYFTKLSVDGVDREIRKVVLLR